MLLPSEQRILGLNGLPWTRRPWLSNFIKSPGHGRSLHRPGKIATGGTACYLSNGADPFLLRARLVGSSVCRNNQQLSDHRHGPTDLWRELVSWFDYSMEKKLVAIGTDLPTFDQSSSVRLIAF